MTHWLALLRLSPYGLLLATGALAGWALARRQARSLGLDPSHLDLLAPLTVGLGIFGALALGWIASAAGLEPSGSRVLYGGLLLAVASGILYAILARLPLGKLGDAVAPGIALGIACGRLGCFLTGCCWGPPCDLPWAIRYAPGSFAYAAQHAAGLLPPDAPATLPIHPVQLYESLATVLLCLALLIVSSRRRPAPHPPADSSPLPPAPARPSGPVWGELFLAFSVGYAAIRFFTEFFRADNPRGLLRLTLAQQLCLAIALVSLITARIRRRHAARWHLLIA